MNLYIENKSLKFIKQAFEYIERNTNKEINKCIVVNYKPGFSKKPYFYFKKQHVYDIEYIMKGLKGFNKAVKLLNYNRNPISLTINIDKELTNKEKKLLRKAKKTIKVNDTSNSLNNESFYQSFNKILYKTNKIDNILDADIMHIYKFYETELQCNFSSCLGKYFYVRKNGDVHFCLKHFDESKIGSIYKDEKIMENELFNKVLVAAIQKRETCQKQCKYYEHCLGACPLQKGCSNFPDLFEKNSSYIDEIVENNKDLTDENYIIKKIIIKDRVYE